MNTVDILLGAKEALLTRGWGQGRYRAVNGGVCLLGALVEAAGPDIVAVRAQIPDPFEAAVGAMQLVANNPVAQWNDAPGRTFNEVIDLIDTTLVRLKESEG